MSTQTITLFLLLMIAPAIEPVLEEEPIKEELPPEPVQEIEESKKEIVPPKVLGDKSWVEFYAGGQKFHLEEGSILDMGAVQIEAAFIGLKDGTPQVLLDVNGESAFLSRKEEKYFDDAYVLVRNVYFID